MLKLARTSTAHARIFFVFLGIAAACTASIALSSPPTKEQAHAPYGVPTRIAIPGTGSIDLDTMRLSASRGRAERNAAYREDARVQAELAKLPDERFDAPPIDSDDLFWSEGPEEAPGRTVLKSPSTLPGHWSGGQFFAFKPDGEIDPVRIYKESQAAGETLDKFLGSAFSETPIAVEPDAGPLHPGGVIVARTNEGRCAFIRILECLPFNIDGEEWPCYSVVGEAWLFPDCAGPAKGEAAKQDPGKQAHTGVSQAGGNQE